MCVICYIPKGVDTPSKEVLKAMYKANPDGVGICTPTMSYKGMSFNVLCKQLSKRTTDEPCLLHFRYATHGSIKKSNCHPFYDENTDTHFMHNGILNIFPKGDMTDSETAFRGVLLPYIKRFGLHSSEVKNTVNQIIGGSRFAFMSGDDVLLFGNYETLGNCLYSNLRFMRYIC